MSKKDTPNIYEQLISCQTIGIVSISVDKSIKLKFVFNEFFFPMAGGEGRKWLEDLGR